MGPPCAAPACHADRSSLAGVARFRCRFLRESFTDGDSPSTDPADEEFEQLRRQAVGDEVLRGSLDDCELQVCFLAAHAAGGGTVRAPTLLTACLAVFGPPV